eukprot:scaffold328_cov248-Pinguiococcus_pyrenoidosus.AAC.12
MRRDEKVSRRVSRRDSRRDSQSLPKVPCRAAPHRGRQLRRDPSDAAIWSSMPYLVVHALSGRPSPIHAEIRASEGPGTVAGQKSYELSHFFRLHKVLWERRIQSEAKRSGKPIPARKHKRDASFRTPTLDGCAPMMTSSMIFSLSIPLDLACDAMRRGRPKTEPSNTMCGADRVGSRLLTCASS